MIHEGLCTYSKAMNQPYPRLCIHCGKPEVQDTTHCIPINDTPLMTISLTTLPDWDDILFEFIDEVPSHQQTLLHLRDWLKTNYNPPTILSK